jgi:hypothetical protein
MNTIDFHKRNFFHTAIADIYRAIDGKSYRGSFILTFCLIDYLTWLEFGHTAELRNNYIKWVEKRLVPINILYTNKGDELNSVSCALIHTYGPSKQMMKDMIYVLKTLEFICKK